MVLTWTELPDKYGTTMTAHSGTWPDMLERIRTVGAFPTKDKCPWIKGAAFGIKRTPIRLVNGKKKGGSLRHDDNVEAVYTIEGDYDGEEVTMAQAAHLLESYGIRAALYPSPSNTAEKPRWRVIAPLARQHTPAERAGLVARLNGALNGILAGESFTLSQGYFFGATPTNDYRVMVTFDDPEDGSCIDDLGELDEIAILKTAPTIIEGAGTTGAPVSIGAEMFEAAVQSKGRLLQQGDGRRDMLKTFIASRSARQAPAGDIRMMIKGIAVQYFDPADPLDEDNIDAIVDHFTTKDFVPPIDISGILPKQTKAEHIDPDTGEIIQGGDGARKVLALLGDKTEDDTGRMRLVSIADVLSNPQPPHPFVWDPYIPAEALSLFSAHGGTGKSGFGMQLSAHIAMGLDFLGFPVLREKTLFFSAEDAASILRIRIADICRNHDIDPAALAKDLHVMDATDVALLWQSDGPRKPGEATANYAALRQYIHEHDIGFLVVDNASDTFGADRFDKSQVTQFVRALVRLVRERSGAVLLLSHVNRSTAAPKGAGKSAGGESYADSVAWHNAARSRLFLAGDDSGEALTLEHEKSNYGKKGTLLNLRRLEGCGMEVVQPAGAGNPAQAYLDELNLTPILTMMDEFYKRGEYIQPVVTAHTNAFKMLAGETGFPKGLKKPELFKLLRDAERRNLIHKEVYTNASRRETERWKVGPAPSAPSAPSSHVSDTSAESAGGRASAPSCVGGMGDCVRADEGAEEGAHTTESAATSTVPIEEGALFSRKRRPILHLKRAPANAITQISSFN
jgi:hypothetical protein